MKVASNSMLLSERLSQELIEAGLDTLWVSADGATPEHCADVDRGRCPFIDRGSVAIRWDGAVSPCLPLMHRYITNLNGKRRSVRNQVIGNLNDRDLSLVCEIPDYVSFRRRVSEFDFSPCTWCGGCSWSEANEKDCFANIFPTCGGCLWAQGVIECP
jgi:MoaA/NifB/PqqE/SkfB family radical SAM enzyme